MGDSLRTGVGVMPQFVAGEQPPAAKFTAITSQVRYGLSNIEKAIGDIHDESWPYSDPSNSRLTTAWGRELGVGTALGGAVDRYLGIVNLARLIGPAANLNPRMTVMNSIEEDIPVGVHEFALRYPQDGVVVFAGDGGALDTLVASTDLVNGAGDYFVDTNGRVYCFTVTSGGTATYDADPALWGGGMGYPGGAFNVIPDPNQTQAGAYAVSVTGPVSGVYTVTLPLISEGQSNIDGDDITLDTYDMNYDVQAVLPEGLTGTFAPGEQIPNGFLLLRDDTTNEVFAGATYTYLDEESFEMSNVDLDDQIGDSDQFSVLTVGTDLTTAVDDLRRKTFHTHDRAWGEPYIDIANIVGWCAQPTDKGSFVPSEIAGNYAPQYLHRDGWNGSEAAANDENMMRGWLLLGIQGATTGNYGNSTGLTYGVAFGGAPSNTATPRIVRNADDLLELKGTVVQTEHGFGGDVVPNNNFVGTKIASWYGEVLVDAGVLSILSLAGGDGPDLTGKTLLGFNIIVKPDPGEDVWVAPNTGIALVATFPYPYEAVLGTGVSPSLGLYISNAGPNAWPTSPANRDYRITVFYN